MINLSIKTVKERLIVVMVKGLSGIFDVVWSRAQRKQIIRLSAVYAINY